MVGEGVVVEGEGCLSAFVEESAASELGQYEGSDDRPVEIVFHATFSRVEGFAQGFDEVVAETEVEGETQGLEVRE